MGTETVYITASRHKVPHNDQCLFQAACTPKVYFPVLVLTASSHVKSPLRWSQDKQLKLYFERSHYNKCAFYGTADFINVPFTAPYKFTAEGHASMRTPSSFAAGAKGTF